MTLLFKVERWSPNVDRIEELIDEFSFHGDAVTSFEQAVAKCPDEPITIRQGIRVIQKSESYIAVKG